MKAGDPVDPVHEVIGIQITGDRDTCREGQEPRLNGSKGHDAADPEHQLRWKSPERGEVQQVVSHPKHRVRRGAKTHGQQALTDVNNAGDDESHRCHDSDANTRTTDGRTLMR